MSGGPQAWVYIGGRCLSNYLYIILYVISQQSVSQIGFTLMDYRDQKARATKHNQ